MCLRLWYEKLRGVAEKGAENREVADVDFFSEIVGLIRLDSIT